MIVVKLTSPVSSQQQSWAGSNRSGGPFGPSLSDSESGSTQTQPPPVFSTLARFLAALGFLIPFQDGAARFRSGLESCS